MWRARAFVACVVYSVISIVLHAYVVSVLSLHLLFFFSFYVCCFIPFFFFVFPLSCFVSFRFFHTHAEPNAKKRRKQSQEKSRMTRNALSRILSLSLSFNHSNLNNLVVLPTPRFASLKITHRTSSAFYFVCYFVN